MNTQWVGIVGQVVTGRLHFDTLSAALAVLTSMITPALLISACGTFILSTSTRAGRVVDRVRVLSDAFEELAHKPQPDPEWMNDRCQLILSQMRVLSARANLLQRSLAALYIATGIFVATSVAIGLVSLFQQGWTWLPVVMGLGGACALFYASLQLIVESRLALRTVTQETNFLLRLLQAHQKTDHPPEVAP